MSTKKEEDFDTRLSGDESANGQGGESRTKWYKRLRKGITTSTADKKETPEGLWSKCPECNYICTTTELSENLYVCPKCNYHHRIGSEDYFEIIFDNAEFTTLFDNITSKDFLGFTDLKPYQKRLDEIHSKTDLKDSMRVAVGNRFYMNVTGNKRNNE